jgi:HPt (histidine-containing phosphotransfer) domain-containing protein
MLKGLLVVSGLVGVVAATAIGARASASSEAMKSIVAAYLEIQTQLVADKTDTVKTEAHTIGAQASAMGAAGSAIAGAAADVEKAADLKAAREAFGPLSDAVIDAAKKDGWTDVSTLKLAYCPMVKRSWLQSGGNVQNPYVGKSMSSCGEFRKMQ